MEAEDLAKGLALASSALNSAFAIGFISAFAGAFAGALGAQRIAERTKARTDLLRELRNTNAAITLAVTTCNAALMCKKQHVTPMIEAYAAHKAGAMEAMNAAVRGEGPTHYRFEADMQFFPAPDGPVESLKNMLFNNISAHGRALALIAMVEQSLIGLKDTLRLRRELIDQLKAMQTHDLTFYERYFGLQNAIGRTDKLYPDALEAIRSYTDDLAFFSALLTDDLIAHGQKLHAKLKKDFKNAAASPRVSTVDFTRPRELGLIPPESEYQDWLRGFTEQAPSKA